MTGRDLSETSALLQAVARGDETALARLWAAHGTRVMAIGQRFLGSAEDGEDVAQETYLKLWRARHRFDPAKSSGEAWLYTVARNVARDKLRRQRIRWLAGLEDLRLEPVDDAPTAAVRAESRAALRDAQAALLELPDAQRMALLLAVVAGLETPDIAEVLGKSRGAVEQLLVRARKRLRLVMEEKGHG